MNFSRLSVLVGAAIATASILSSTSPAHALTFGFQNEYNPANWAFNNNSTGGTVDTTNAPTSITLTGGDNGTIGNTDYTITAPDSGLVSGNWNYTTLDVDGSAFDLLSYILNGAGTQLSNDGGSTSQSGTFSFSVVQGDVFGFRIFTIDGGGGAASTTFSSFSAPSAAVPFDIPGGATIPAVGGLLALGLMRKARKSLASNTRVSKPMSEIVS